MANSIGLWDLRDENIFVKLKPDFVKSMFDVAIDTACMQKTLTKELGIAESMISFYKNGNKFIKIGILSKIINMLPEGKKNEYEIGITNNLIEINHGSGRAIPIKPKLPIVLSPEMARICGHLIGDGSINIVNRVFYGNKCNELTEIFKSDIRHVFGDDVHIEEYINRQAGLKNVCCSTIIGVILKTFFGEMSYKRIPACIFGSDSESKKLFIRALFDDEGHVGVPNSVIQINLTIKSILVGLKMLLEEFGILTGEISEYERIGKKNIYVMRISGREHIRLFHEMIGFDHPNKDRQTRECIEAYKFKQNRYGKPEFTRKMILGFIESKENATKQEIAMHLKRTPTSLKYHLLWLERQNMIKSRVNNLLKVYSTNK